MSVVGRSNRREGSGGADEDDGEEWDGAEAEFMYDSDKGDAEEGCDDEMFDAEEEDAISRRGGRGRGGLGGHGGGGSGGSGSGSSVGQREHSSKSAPLPLDERIRLRGEFERLMREFFLAGKDADFFDYDTIDHDESLDDLAIREQDAEEAWFDDE